MEWGRRKTARRCAQPYHTIEVPPPIPSHFIAAGLVPLFSPFLLAVLSHYQIRLLHLRPEAITILSIFAFSCEAWLGVRPSVAYLRHLFELRLVAPE